MSAKQDAAETNKKGNAALSQGDLTQALAFYNASLAVIPLAVTFNNRALVFLKLGRYNDAISDCNKVIEKEADNWKAFYRRSLCHNALGNMQSAFDDVKSSLELSPDRNKLEVQKLVKDIVESSSLTVMCKCTIEPVESESNVMSLNHFRYDHDEDEEHVITSTLDEDVEKCPHCESHICHIWNWKSKEKSCVLPSCSVTELLEECCFRGFFPKQSRAIHDYGFCNMALFYRNEYYPEPPSPSMIESSDVLLGLYQLILNQICHAVEGRYTKVMSSHSFPLSLKALHQAYEKNSLDAYIQQYIADLKSQSLEQYMSEKYPDMWIKRKYIIGPTCLSAKHTLKDVENTRKKLFHYFYGSDACDNSVCICVGPGENIVKATLTD